MRERTEKGWSDSLHHAAVPIYKPAYEIKNLKICDPELVFRLTSGVRVSRVPGNRREGWGCRGRDSYCERSNI